MTKKEVLDGSIQKWWEIVWRDSVDEGPDNCPLCEKYHNEWKDGCCDGCPIREDTGKQFCRLTPYKVFEDARCPEDQLKAARAMLRYLKNLRKKLYGGEV